MNENPVSKSGTAINEHHCQITKTTTKKHIPYTILIKPKPIILRIIDVPMGIITIKKQHITNSTTNNISKKHYTE